MPVKRKQIEDMYRHLRKRKSKEDMEMDTNSSESVYERIKLVKIEA